jgi:tetratricopeptide (TPR) repeat protein
MKCLFVCLLLSTTIGCNSDSNPSTDLSVAERAKIELERGDDLFERRDYVTAIAFYTRAISCFEGNWTYDELTGAHSPEKTKTLSQAYFARALAHHWLKENYRALSDYRQARIFESWLIRDEDGSRYIDVLPPTLPDDYVNKYLSNILSCRATAFVANGESGRAILELKEAIQLDPTRGMLYLVRGFVYEEIGKKELSEADYLKAKELGIKFNKELQWERRRREAGEPLFRFSAPEH